MHILDAVFLMSNTNVTGCPPANLPEVAFIGRSNVGKSSLINMLVKPLFVLLTLPITIVTVGLFLFVINALMFWLAGSILKGFQVNGFWWAVGGALLYSLISGFLTNLINK